MQASLVPWVRRLVHISEAQELHLVTLFIMCSCKLRGSQ